MKSVSLIIALLCYMVSFSQVGIGTTTPNPQSILDISSDSLGLLIPRMTSTQKLAMNLTSDDAGMMVYQTSPSKGFFMFDGTSWAGITGSTITGATMKWEESAKCWVGTTNLFNQGSSIGIGTTTPKSKLHLNSFTNVPSTQIQITNLTTGHLGADGLLMGISHATGEAHLIHQEQKAIILGTNSLERMRIDSAGKVGINNIQPQANLDVNGTSKFGLHGTPLTGIMRDDVMIDLPSILGQATQIVDVPFPNTVETATVYVSPGSDMDGIMICFARVNTPGNVQLKFINLTGLPIDQSEMIFYITVIQ